VKLLVNKFKSLSSVLGGSKTVVFVRTRTLAESYAKHLNGLPFHRGLSDDDLRENSRLFRIGQADVLCCTTAFGVGVDIPNIRFSIHVGAPYSLTNFYQESGRIGRDGASSSAHIVYDISDDRENALSQKGVDKIYDFLRARDECLRGFLTAAFDNLPCCCYSCPGLNTCQYCFYQSRGTSSIRNSVQNQAPAVAEQDQSIQIASTVKPPNPQTAPTDHATVTPAPPPPSPPAESPNKRAIHNHSHQPTILVPATPPIQHDATAHPDQGPPSHTRSLGEKRVHEEESEDETRPARLRQRMIVKSQTPVPSSQSPQLQPVDINLEAQPVDINLEAQPMDVDLEDDTAQPVEEREEQQHAPSTLTKAQQPIRGLCVESFLAGFDASDRKETAANNLTAARSESSISDLTQLSVQELVDEEKRKELAEEEEFRREIQALRRFMTEAEKCKAWKAVKSFMDDNKKKCWWCMRDPIAEKRCQATSTYECQIKDGSLAKDFERWKNFHGSTFKEHMQRPGVNKYGNNNCGQCYLPSTAPGHMYSESDKCNLGDNTRALVFLILNSNWWRPQLLHSYPEAYNVDAPTSLVNRDWVMRDVRRCGDSGMVRILEWWFLRVCRKTFK